MRKRSRYRPKPVIVDTMAHVRLSIAPVTDMPKLIDTRIRNHDCLASLAQGRATRADIDVIIAALNIAEALIMQDVGKEYLQQLRDGQAAIVELSRRGLERGSFIATGPQLTAINWAMELHDAQLDVITVAQLERAIAKVQAIVLGGGAQAVTPHRPRRTCRCDDCIGFFVDNDMEGVSEDD